MSLHSNQRLLALTALLSCSLLVAACATMQGREPPQVNVAGFEPLEGQGLEVRLNVKLRVQNPNDTPIDYNGVSVQMNVQGKAFATGVSAAAGSVPRFGESVIEVPVTISAFRMASQVFSFMHGGANEKITYELKGKLSGPGFSSAHFTTSGDFEMPTGIAPEAKD
jgi:LEA14-like dessication related protein